MVNLPPTMYRLLAAKFFVSNFLTFRNTFENSRQLTTIPFLCLYFLVHFITLSNDVHQFSYDFVISCIDLSSSLMPSNKLRSDGIFFCRIPGCTKRRTRSGYRSTHSKHFKLHLRHHENCAKFHEQWLSQAKQQRSISYVYYIVLVSMARS